MGPKITIIGGGSYQWVPTLLVDMANTPVLHDAEIVIEDIDPAPIPRMVELVEHVADVRGIGLTAKGTTNQREALEGADYVVVNISTGGFESMRHDLEIPERYGIKQSVGDTVGPGGIVRALRNIPVFLEIARNMEELCPDAWLLNLTNPMTTICRAVTRESSITTIGLCHEVTIAQYTLSLLLDASFMDIKPTVAGVNHLPFITELDVAGEDGLERLRELIDQADVRGSEGIATAFPEGLGHEKISEGGEWTKGDLLHQNQVKFELLRRFGVLPGAGDRHLVEFFPNFLTADSGWGDRWGVALTTIDEREKHQAGHIRDFEEMLASPEVSEMPSGELVAAIIQCRTLDQPGWFPLNLPNAGQVADLPMGVVVESMGVVDGAGPRGRDEVTLPPAMAAELQQVSAAQELTVEAGVSGRRDAVFEAMLVDPLAGRIDYDALDRMTDEMLTATKPWLPQFGVNALTVRVHADAAELGVAAADDAARAIGEAIAERGSANVMFASGNSQLAFLDSLTGRDDVDWSRLTGFHMDEYCGISAEHPASFRRYMRERIVERAHPREFHEIQGDAPDARVECDRYTELLREHPLDLCCLGIGENGHLAFNDPPVARFDDPLDVKVVELDDACQRQQVGEGHFPSIDDVPALAITVTIPALLRARTVLAIVPEARKCEPVRRALTGPVDTSCPASILRTMSHVTLHLDTESASGLEPGFLAR